MHEGFQRHMWANGVGDDWFRRNREALGNRDLAYEALVSLKIEPKSVLEVGCANGWRLKKFQQRWGCEIAGIDCSKESLAAAVADGIPAILGTADDLSHWPAASFDCVVFGFCLCFISPEDWFPLVSETDRVLRDGGRVVITDFMGTRFVKRRMDGITTDKALEKDPVYIYNFNWQTLWTAHPAYKIEADMFDFGRVEAACVIRKHMGQLLDDGRQMS